MKPTTKIKLIGALFCVTILALALTANAGPHRFSAKEVEPVPAAPEFDWTGFYIGGNVGGFWSNYRFSDYDTDVDVDAQFKQFDGLLFSAFGPDGFGTETFSAPSTSSGSDGNATGGGQVGFQKQWGHLVFGIEGDFNRTSTTRSTSFESSQFNPGDTNGILVATTDLKTMRTAETDWTASARARVGWARGPVLLYVTGGAAFADVRTWANDTATTTFILVGEIESGSQTNSNSSRDTDIMAGWTVGGGGEYALNDTFSIALEYRHSDFGDNTFHFSSNSGPIFPGPVRVSTDSDQVVFKVNVNLCKFFGWRH